MPGFLVLFLMHSKKGHFFHELQTDTREPGKCSVVFSIYSQHLERLKHDGGKSIPSPDNLAKLCIKRKQSTKFRDINQWEGPELNPLHTCTHDREEMFFEAKRSKYWEYLQHLCDFVSCQKKKIIARTMPCEVVCVVVTLALPGG